MEPVRPMQFLVMDLGAAADSVHDSAKGVSRGVGIEHWCWNDVCVTPLGGLGERCIQVTEEMFALKNFEVLGWRDIPIDESVVGRIAKSTWLFIEQVIVCIRNKLEDDALERELFIGQSMIKQQKAAELREDAGDFYFCMLSCQAIAYKSVHLPWVISTRIGLHFVFAVCYP